jgi:hypothetical protein
MKFSGRGAKEPAGPGPTPPGPEGAYGAELRNNFYFLWSLERVCAVFGLNDINGFDWHGWVVDFVLKWQAPDGSWSGTKIGFHGSPSNDIVDTSFALMFLMKANIVKDLTKLLKSGELPSKPSEARPGAAAGNARPPVKPAPNTNVAKEADSAALTDALVKAGPSEQELLIERYEKEKGGIYSQALADAIPKLSGEAQLKARDALASRMARMSARTLKAWLKDADSPELRRAAAIAMSMGDDVSELKSFVPDLIEALNDADEIVWRGAAVGLREIAKKVPGGADGANLGPRKDDSEAKRRKAIADWKAWYEKHKG